MAAVLGRVGLAWFQSIRRRVGGRSGEAAGQQASGMLGHVGQIEITISFGSAATTDREQARQPTIRFAIGRPEDDGRRIAWVDFSTDDKFQRILLGRRMCSHNA